MNDAYNDLRSLLTVAMKGCESLRHAPDLDSEAKQRWANIRDNLPNALLHPYVRSAELAPPPLPAGASAVTIAVYEHTLAAMQRFQESNPAMRHSEATVEAASHLFKYQTGGSLK
jgi:hypothetical protein